MPCMAECRPIAWRRRRWLNPVLARERAECPGDLSGAVGQPGQDTLTSAVRWRVTGAEVAHPYGLDTGTEDRRASDRFQALRPKILWSRGVSRRHIVARPAYYTTGGGCGLRSFHSFSRSRVLAFSRSRVPAFSRSRVLAFSRRGHSRRGRRQSPIDRPPGDHRKSAVRQRITRTRERENARTRERENARTRERTKRTLICPVEAEAARSQPANDLRQGQRVLRGVADVEDVHRAGRRQLQAASQDVGRLRAAPTERVDRPADFVRVAGQLDVGR